jgi:hypothetical protein
MEQQSEAAAVAAAVAAQAQAAAAAHASSSSSSSKRKRKTPGGEAAAAAVAAAESSNAVKRGFSITSNEESRRGDNEVEEENGRLKQEVSSYHATMENMAREIEALRYKVDQQQQQQQVTYIGYPQNGTPGLQVSWGANHDFHPSSLFLFPVFFDEFPPPPSPKPFPTALSWEPFPSVLLPGITPIDAPMHVLPFLFPSYGHARLLRDPTQNNPCNVRTPTSAHQPWHRCKLSTHP